MKAKVVKKSLVAAVVILFLGELLMTNLTLNVNGEEQSTIAGESAPQYGLSHIHIKVKEINNTLSDVEYTPLSGVKITLIYRYFQIQRKITDIKGKCSFLTLPGGTYLIHATKFGYRDISSGLKQFRIIQLPSADVLDVHFILLERRLHSRLFGIR